MHCATVVFTQHAFVCMFARNISPQVVRQAVRSGDVIASYPDDRPYPSFLLLYFSGRRALHIVVGYDDAAKVCFVITAYWPDADMWNDDFKTRRQR